MSSGGLGFPDTGDKSVIGGLAREFYHLVWLPYRLARRQTPEPVGIGSYSIGNVVPLLPRQSRPASEIDLHRSDRIAIISS
ncbi:MAG: hypothetical protein ABFD90_05910 [Phycisphaerales bacterium]